MRYSQRCTSCTPVLPHPSQLALHRCQEKRGCSAVENQQHVIPQATYRTCARLPTSVTHTPQMRPDLVQSMSEASPSSPRHRSQWWSPTHPPSPTRAQHHMGIPLTKPAATAAVPLLHMHGKQHMQEVANSTHKHPNKGHDHAAKHPSSRICPTGASTHAQLACGEHSPNCKPPCPTTHTPISVSDVADLQHCTHCTPRTVPHIHLDSALSTLTEGGDKGTCCPGGALHQGPPYTPTPWQANHPASRSAAATMPAQ